MKKEKNLLIENAINIMEVCTIGEIEMVLNFLKSVKVNKGTHSLIKNTCFDSRILKMEIIYNKESNTLMSIFKKGEFGCDIYGDIDLFIHILQSLYNERKEMLELVVGQN